MSLDDARAPASGFTTGTRVGAFVICSILGPALTGVFFALQSALSDMVAVSRGDLLSAFLFSLSFSLPAVLFGTPVAFPVSLCGLWLFRHRRRIPLSAFLSMGVVAISLMVLWLRKPYETSLDTLRTIGLFVLPVLASSALCWRITKRWHSPEPTP